MLMDYGSIRKGDVGLFLQCNSRQPPAQFQWRDYKHTYWVHWQQVELLDTPTRAQPKAVTKVTQTKARDGSAMLWEFGMRASLWMLFSHLRQTWEGSNTANLAATTCLITEALGLVRELPNDTIPNKCATSPHWTAVLHEVCRLLLDVAGPGAAVPADTRDSAIILGLEIAVRTKRLRSLLGASITLLRVARNFDRASEPPFVIKGAVGVLRQLSSYCEQNDDVAEAEQLVATGRDGAEDLNVMDCAVELLRYAARLQPSRTLSARVFTLGDIPNNDANDIDNGESSMSGAPSVWRSVASLSPVQIVAGAKVVLFVTQSGQLFVIGCGRALGLGLGPSGSVSTPIEIQFPDGDIEIAHVSANHHVLACTRDGALYSWGDNARGCLGQGDDAHLDRPKRVDGIGDVVFTSCGESYSAAVTRVAWTYSSSSSSSDDQGSGNLFTWGRASLGRLGHGDRVDQSTPRLVMGLVGSDVTPIDVVQVSCGSGDAHTLVLTRAGRVYSFGDADHGKLGRDRNDATDKPRMIKALEGHRIVKVCAGSSFSMALADTGVLYTFGNAQDYVLGTGSCVGSEKTPVALDLLEDCRITDVSVGDRHVIAVTETADVYAWGKTFVGSAGDNGSNQMPDGQRTLITSPTKIESLSGQGVSSVSAGPNFCILWSSCVLSQVGTTGHFNSDGSPEITSMLKEWVLTANDISEESHQQSSIHCALDLLLSHITKLNRLHKDKCVMETRHLSELSALKSSLVQRALSCPNGHITHLARESLLASWSYIDIDPAEHESLRDAIVQDACGALVNATLRRGARRLLDIYWKLLMPTMLERLEIVLQNYAGLRDRDGTDPDANYLTTLLLGSLLSSDACLPFVFGKPSISLSSEKDLGGSPVDTTVYNKVTETRASLLRLMVMIVEDLASHCRNTIATTAAGAQTPNETICCDANHALVATDRPYRDNLWICNKCEQVGQGCTWHCAACSFDICAQCAPLGPAYVVTWMAVVLPETYQDDLSANDMVNKKDTLLEQMRGRNHEMFAADGTAIGTREECEDLVKLAQNVGLKAELRANIANASGVLPPEMVAAMDVLHSAQSALLASVAFRRSVHDGAVDALTGYAESVFTICGDLLVEADGMAGNRNVREAIMASPVGTILPQFAVGLQCAVFNNVIHSDIDMSPLMNPLETLLFQIDAFNSQW